MKKIFLFLILGGLIFTGCSIKKKDPFEQFSKKLENINSYYLEGSMDIINNEDIYTYDVKVSYQKDNNYKVELTNISNNHKQVILRNSEGVYVVTPSLNKSFKFQSDWPHNNSQVYLLESIISDLEVDEERSVQEKGEDYILTSKVNYPNNKKLVKQSITLDKNYDIKEASVLDENGNVQIKMTFNKVDLKSEFDNNYFNLNTLITEKEEVKDNDSSNESNENSEEGSTQSEGSTATIDDIIYPMYLPTNTYLSNQEKIMMDNGQRLILTFEGDNPFTLIEETVGYSEDHEIIPTFGELTQLSDTIGVVNDNSVNWFSNGIEYYVVSDTMASSELLDIARSISVLPVSK